MLHVCSFDLIKHSSFTRHLRQEVYYYRSCQCLLLVFRHTSILQLRVLLVKGKFGFKMAIIMKIVVVLLGKYTHIHIV